MIRIQQPLDHLDDQLDDQQTHTALPAWDQLSLKACTLKVLDDYFSYLDKAIEPVGVLGLVTQAVESAAYGWVMKHSQGNQTKAAQLAGVSRGTLRAKLKRYFKTTNPPISEDSSKKKVRVSKKKDDLVQV